MPTILGSVAAKATLDSSGMVKGVEQANASLATMNKTVGSSAGGLARYSDAAKAALIGGIGLVITGLKASVDAAMESQRVMAQTESVIKSTGGAAGFSATQIADMAQSFVNVSTYGDEAIQSMMNVLLTFPQIKGDTFKQASQAILDMSTALGTDLQGAAIQVGKALQDPILGVTALRRVGVNFSASQTEVIKKLVETGHAAEAQQIILKELATEFGGSAAAAGNTFAGKLEHARNALDNVAEAIGNELLPFLSKAADGFVLLVTGAQQLADVAKKVRDEVTATAKTYGEYADKVVASGVAAGDFTEVTDKNTKAEISASIAAGKAASFYRQIGDHVVVVTKDIDLMTEAQWNNKKAAFSALETLVNTNPALKKLGELYHEATKSEAEFRQEQDLVNAVVGESRALAIQYTDDGKKLTDLYRQLADLDAEIVKNGPAHIAVIQKTKMSDEERYATTLHLTEAQKELARVEANVKPGDLVHADHVAKLKKEVDGLTASLASYSGVVGGATKEQQKNREDLLKSIAAWAETAKLERGKMAFDALNKTFMDPNTKMSQAEYIRRSEILNMNFGLYETGALKAATAQSIFVKAIADPAVNNWTTFMADAKTAADAYAAGLNPDNPKSPTAHLTAEQRKIEEMDKETIPAMSAAQDLAMRRMTGAFATMYGPADTAKQKFLDLKTAIDNVPKTVKISVSISQTGALPDAAGMGHKATGGPVIPWQAYVVGERGPEIFVPSQAGTIVPNGGSAKAGSGLPAMGGDTFITNIYDRTSANLIGALIEERKRKRLNEWMGG